MNQLLEPYSNRKTSTSFNTFGTFMFAFRGQTNASENYSFGMELKGRTFDNTGYKFGMNGQMKDNEIYGEGNTYSAQYWEYDARLGRRWNLDPKPQISISDYACFGNNPIVNIDVHGGEINPYWWTNNFIGKFLYQQEYLYFVGGKAQLELFNKNKVELMTNKAFKKAWNDINISSKYYEIQQTTKPRDEDKNVQAKFIGDENGGRIIFYDCSNKVETFEEIYHAAQNNFYGFGKQQDLAVEVEEQFVEEFTGLSNEFGMKDNLILKNYYEKINSGQKVSEELRKHVNQELIKYAKVMLSSGYEEFYNNQGTLKENSIENFNPNTTLKYFESEDK